MEAVRTNYALRVAGTDDLGLTCHDKHCPLRLEPNWALLRYRQIRIVAEFVEDRPTVGPLAIILICEYFHDFCSDPLYDTSQQYTSIRCRFISTHYC